MGIIYKITNKINGKCYIGQTSRSLNKRQNEHCNLKGSSKVLSTAINKYSANNFEITVLETVTDNSKLDDLEKEYIIKYNSISPNGYNLESEGKLCKKMSEESCEKMR